VLVAALAVCTGATLVAHHTPDDTPTHPSRCCRTRGPHAVCRRRGAPVAAADSPFGDLWSDDDDTDDAEDLTLTERLEETIDMGPRGALASAAAAVSPTA